MKKKLGIVAWFDKHTGDGQIWDLENGGWLFVHYSAINSLDDFRKLDKYDLVEFSVYSNLYMSQVDRVKVLEPEYTEDLSRINDALDLLLQMGYDILRVEPKYGVEL